MSEFRIDPETGDYSLASTGLPEKTTSLLQPAYVRLRTELGQWMHDPSLGSRYHELERVKITPAVEAQTVEFAEQALRPIVEDGRATKVTIETVESSRVGRRVRGRITDNIDRLPERIDFILPVG